MILRDIITFKDKHLRIYEGSMSDIKCIGVSDTFDGNITYLYINTITYYYKNIYSFIKNNNIFGAVLMSANDMDIESINGVIILYRLIVVTPQEVRLLGYLEDVKPIKYAVDALNTIFDPLDEYKFFLDAVGGNQYWTIMECLLDAIKDDLLVITDNSFTIKFGIEGTYTYYLNVDETTFRRFLTKVITLTVTN